MPDRRLLLAIAAIIALPILFATLGGGQYVGIAIGVALVIAGVASGLVTRDRGDHGGGSGEDRER